MKQIIFLFLLSAMTVAGQQLNKQIVDEKSGKHILIGCCDREAFADTSFSWWFDSEYDNYALIPDVIEKIKSSINNVSITIIMGSWCSDSRREVPRLYKILDSVLYDYSKLTLIGVDRSKKSPDGEVDKLDIKLVPTFIINRDGKELGKIIESPKNTLEADLLEILNM